MLVIGRTTIKLKFYAYVVKNQGEYSEKKRARVHWRRAFSSLFGKQRSRSCISTKKYDPFQVTSWFTRRPIKVVSPATWGLLSHDPSMWKEYFNILQFLWPGSEDMGLLSLDLLQGDIYWISYVETGLPLACCTSTLEAVMLPGLSDIHHLNIPSSEEVSVLQIQC